MTCEEVQEWLIEAHEKDIPTAVRADIQGHVEDCAQCAALQAEFDHLFQLMTGTPEALPGPGLEKQFREMLRTAEQEQKATRRVHRIPVWRNIAAAIVLVAAGIGIGFRLASPRTLQTLPGTAPAIAHAGDSTDSRLFTLLKEASASERIRAVNYAETMTAPNQKVIDALINTLDHDKNANVRLACLYSLARFTDNQKVRDAMVSSLPRQTEPIVQIVLINLLTEMRESKAKRPLQDIISNTKTSKEVKNIAEKGLRTM
jgi:hypothetical protein